MRMFTERSKQLLKNMMDMCPWSRNGFEVIWQHLKVFSGLICKGYSTQHSEGKKKRYTKEAVGRQL